MNMRICYRYDQLQIQDIDPREHIYASTKYRFDRESLR